MYKHKQQAFTIVELLIVIVVIAILAAISIVAYNGIQNRAYDAAVQSDLKNAYNKLLVFQTTDTSGTFPNGTAGELSAVGISASKNAHYSVGNNFLYCVADRTTSSPKALIVSRSKSGKTYYHSTRDGGREYTGASNVSAFATICDELLPATGTLGGDGAEYGILSGAWTSWTNG